MRDKDFFKLAGIYESILESHSKGSSGEKPCPCEKEDGVCTKQNCECEVCDKVMDKKESESKD